MGAGISSAEPKRTGANTTPLRARASHRILSAPRRRQPFVDKLLNTVALRLAGHEIAVRIDAEAVEMKELARLASGSADVADLFKRRAIQDCDTFVRAVRDVGETLLRIGRQGNAECSAGSSRFTLDEPFLQEGAVELERL